MKKFTILLLLIALVGLFAWTYSKNIIITLLLLTVLGLIFDKIPVLLDKEKSSKEKMIACTLLVIFITSTILFTNKEIISDKYAKSSGSILGSLKDEKITRVLIDVGADFKFLKLPMIYTEGKPVFENFNIWIENNEVMLSSLIRNKTGKILARLEANEWQVNPNKILDRNFDNKAIEVIGEDGEVILQADIKGYDTLPDKTRAVTVRFKGIFTDTRGWRFVLGSKSTEEGSFVQIIPPELNNEKIKFDKIFRYPSEQHPGERIR